MALKIGDVAPDFEADTTEGHLRFHEWLGDSWGVLVLAPEGLHARLHDRVGLHGEDEARIRQAEREDHRHQRRRRRHHKRWSNDIKETQGYAPNYPMIGDPTLAISKLYGMLPAEAGDSCEGRTAADNQTVRNVFVVGPDKKIKLLIVYPMTTGRNFDEVLRVLDSLQLTAKHKVATPVNWKQGDNVIIAGSVSDEEAKKTYPQGWSSPRPYIRIVPQPGTKPV